MQKFADSFEELLDGIRAKRRELAAGVSAVDRRADLGATTRRSGPTRARTAGSAGSTSSRASEPHVDELNAFAEAATEQFDDCVLLGMGGSSLAPEVLRRTFNVESFHVLDTTHPEAIRRLERSLDLEQTLFLVSSKSGSTIETRSHLEYFWERTGGRGAQFAAITDPARSSTSSRTSAASGRSSPASRRSAAATRRSRCSGSCPPR